MVEVIGWTSSVILLVTLIKQVHKQWSDATSEGISAWLSIGQLCASVGFTIYSALTGSIVFVVTNSILTVTNIIGIIMYFRFKE